MIAGVIFCLIWGRWGHLKIADRQFPDEMTGTYSMGGWHSGKQD